VRGDLTASSRLFPRARLAGAALLVAFAFASAAATSVRAQDAPTSPPEPAPSATSAPGKPPAPAVAAKRHPVEPKPADVEPGDPTAPTTPRRAFAAFLRAAERGDFTKAAELLDLRGLPRGREAREGPELASMLYRVLGWRVSLDPSALPDEATPHGVGPEGVVLDSVEIEGRTHSLALAPVRGAAGEVRWAFSRTTVGSIRTIYEANERLAVEERVPEWLKRSKVFGLLPWQWLGIGVVALLSYVLGRGGGSLAAAGLHRLARPFSRTVVEAAKSLERPARLVLAATAFQLLSSYLLLTLSFARAADKIATIAYIVGAAWAAIAMMRVLTQSWERRLPEDTAGDLESRGLRTRLKMMRRIGTVIVGLIAAGVALLQFEVVRSVGVSLLASAGIAGILVGIAAQRTLGGIIAGIEVSITQPVRIGDIVVFKPGEIGTVEQIYFTYIIVRLWDDRRMIVPVTRLMADAFENWTRTDAKLLAPVEIFVDYAIPFDKLRDAFRELCEANDKWDGRVCRVELIETTDKALKVRGIASVDVAPKAWDLRSELREGWVRFVQGLEDGRYLPVGRVESRTAPSAPVAPPTPGSPGASEPLPGPAPDAAPSETRSASGPPPPPSKR
jgi:small-conductance mechanosensitive channel